MLIDFINIIARKSQFGWSSVNKWAMRMHACMFTYVHITPLKRKSDIEKLSGKWIKLKEIILSYVIQVIRHNSECPISCEYSFHSFPF